MAGGDGAKNVYPVEAVGRKTGSDSTPAYHSKEDDMRR